MSLVSLIIEALSQLRDVVITSPTNGQTLTYNSSTGKWVNSTSSSSSTLHLRGPYIVDYTDIPHDGDKKTLWVPQPGEVLLRLISDLSATIGFDHGLLYIGQNVDGTVSPPHNIISYQNNTSPDGTGFSPMVWLDTIYSEQQFNNAGVSFNMSSYMFHNTNPVQIQVAQTLGTDPTQGHVELYALIATATAP